MLQEVASRYKRFIAHVIARVIDLAIDRQAIAVHNARHVEGGGKMRRRRSATVMSPHGSA
jgi:hypothetical protein